MSACPNCFQQLPPDHYAWVCKSGKCEPKPDPVATAFAGGAVSTATFTELKKGVDDPKKWPVQTEVFCGSCGVKKTDACPFCHYGLMANWRSAQTTAIAMNGARATGKSFYIAVAIKQLNRLMAQVNTTVEFANTHTRDTYSSVYERPLYEELGIMEPTPRSDTADSYQREPMIFNLGMIGGQRRFLIIRDVAGEEMEKAQADAQNLAFFKHADGVFFMFDPLAIPEIKAKLQDFIPQQLYVGGDPRTVLGNLLLLLGTSTPKVAIIISKFDALQALRDVDDFEWKTIMSNPGAAFLRDGSLDASTYDEADGELLHLEVRSLLYKLGAQSFVISLEQQQESSPFDHRFFAVSVLGDSPEGRTLSKFGISPFRIVDPLKWVLSSKSVI